MKCERCRKTIRLGVKFCPNCGEPVKGGDASEPEPEKTENPRQKADLGALAAKGLGMPSGESGKKNRQMLFALMSAAVILIVLCVILGRPKSVFLSPSEYVEVTCSGLNGEGKALLRFQTEKFMEALGKKKKLKPAQQSEIMEILKGANQYFSLTKNTDLTNGDKLSIQCSMPEDLLEAYQIKLKNAEIGFKVVGLTEIQQVKNLTLKDKDIDLITDDMTIVSISPDGTKLLGYRENGDRPMFLADLEKQQIIDIWPDYENSVEDTYGMVDRSLTMYTVYSWVREQIADTGAVAWSSDSEYIALANYGSGFLHLQAMDLLLIMTSNGAMRDIETTSGNPWIGDGDVGGWPVSVCFDPVFPVLYYVEYGGRYETECTLKQFDLISEEVTVLSSLPDIKDIDESFLCYRDLYCPIAKKIVFAGEDGQRDYSAFCTVGEAEEGWNIESSIYEQYSESYQYRPLYLYFSRGNVGIAVYIVQEDIVNGYHSRYYSIIDLNDPTQVNILQFESIEQNRVDTIGIQELVSSLEKEGTAKSSEENYIITVAISPGGKYALLKIKGNSDEDIQLKVLDLKTMEWKDVGVPEDMRLCPYNYGPKLEDGIRWGAGNLILALDENLEVRILEFAED